MIPAQSQCLITRFRLAPNSHGASLEIPCAQFWSGNTMRDIESLAIGAAATAGFVKMDYPWSDSFRTVYVCREEQAIFTYCEGDLDLTMDDSPDVFAQRLASAEQFYRELAGGAL